MVLFFVTEIFAGTAPQEGPCGTKFVTSYIAALLLIVSVCAIMIVGELGALVSYAAKSSSPGMWAVSWILETIFG
jgi:hypothetical protein